MCQDLPQSVVKRIEKAAEREKSHADPNTTPIGDDDYYFHRPDVGEFEAVYYNLDATAGGQFVFAHLPYDLIAEAKAATDSTDGFFEYLDEHAKTELVDLGTPEYDAVLKEYTDPHPERIGRSEDTMNTLVSQAESEVKQEKHLPQFYRDYLEIKADNPNSLVLYQMGDFFEAYADDAEVVGIALELGTDYPCRRSQHPCPNGGISAAPLGNLPYNADRQRVRCRSQRFGGWRTHYPHRGFHHEGSAQSSPNLSAGSTISARTARSVKASSTPVLISLRRTSRRKTTTVCQ